MPEKNRVPHTGEALDELLQDIEESLRKAKILRSEVEGIREEFHRILKKRQTDSIEEDNSDVSEITQEEEPVISLSSEILEERTRSHEEWVNTIRDPASEKSEGLRILQAGNGKATAEYEIALLPNDRWAMRMSLAYHSGNMEGKSTPWSEYASRKECLDQFVKRTSQFFGQEIDNSGNNAQQQARTEILELLKGGLFGFMEPEPEK